MGGRIDNKNLLEVKIEHKIKVVSIDRFGTTLANNKHKKSRKGERTALGLFEQRIEHEIKGN